ncbi:hypothetical protein PsorP6_006491 [Peronosclerospora sorghi]|uniref:Uncharacterized protein n=1 Tax=Peronosclerospora sorghi TaxID=230839 RepID=A0ACC0W3G9_9STRA|nr:hypothetical protein PsorP6_006491 [Peronosclerospora sorghi]
MQLFISLFNRKGRISRNDTEVAALLGCYQTARLDHEANKHQERDRIITCEMGICGLCQWMVKQTTDKYNNLLTTYREGRRKLDETGGGGLESYRKKYPLWDAMAALLAGNASVQPEHIFYDGVVTTRASATTSSSSRGGNQEATPSRHRNGDILPKVADKNDDSDESLSQPPPPSKRRQVSKAANNDNIQVILEMEKQRQNFAQFRENAHQGALGARSPTRSC